MSPHPLQQLELHDLIDATFEDGLGESMQEHLESLLLDDDDACRYYLDYSYLHGTLMLAAEQQAKESLGTKAPGLDVLLPGISSQELSSVSAIRHPPSTIRHPLSKTAPSLPLSSKHFLPPSPRSLLSSAVFYFLT